MIRMCGGAEKPLVRARTTPAAIARHLEDHGYGCHHRAGGAACHCTHADHRKGRNIDTRQLPQGRGLGIAGHYSFVTYVAAAAEVEVTPKKDLIVHRVDIAMDCGPRANPERVVSQMEGAVIMVLTTLNYSEVTYRNGAAQQQNFTDYEMVRIDSSPRAIHAYLVGGDDWNQPLGGVGEPGLPPVIPAICNAIFAASGKRIRSLPIKDQLKA